MKIDATPEMGLAIIVGLRLLKARLSDESQDDFEFSDPDLWLILTTRGTPIPTPDQVEGYIERVLNT